MPILFEPVLEKNEECWRQNHIRSDVVWRHLDRVHFNDGVLLVSDCKNLTVMTRLLNEKR